MLVLVLLVAVVAVEVVQGVAAAVRIPTGCSDLKGLDPDDTLEGEEVLGAAHLGAELEALHLKKHDGRLGLQEDLRNLEPLPPMPPSNSSGAESSRSSGGEEEEEDGTEAMDPLGAVRTPLRRASAEEGSGSGAPPHSLI